MERYVRFIVRHRVAVVVAVLLVTALLGTQLVHLHLEIRRRAQLPQDHPYVQVQNRIADLFGGETTLIIGVIAKRGDIFTPEILHKIARITQRLQNLPGVVQSNLLSIAAERVKAIERTPAGMDVRPLLGKIPSDPVALAALRKRVLDYPIYRGTLVAPDGTATAIVADFDDRYSDAEIVHRVNAIVAPERDGSVDFPLGGAPLVRADVAHYTRQMALLFPIAVLVIALIHYEAFRTLQAMFLPLVTALLSVVWALGIMGALRQPMDTWSAITPVVILAVAAGHAVQILKRYYEEFGKIGNSEEAVIRSVTAIGPVMLTAGIIASAGFASLLTFGVTSVRVFGMLIALGILSSLIIEMTFIPACRVLLPSPRGEEALRERRGRILPAILEAIARGVLTQPRSILGIALVLFAIAAVGALRLHVDNSFRTWFPADSSLRRDDALLNDRLAGTSTLYLLLEGRSEGDLEKPEVLRAVRDLESWLRKQPKVGATLSLADFVERMNQVMAEPDAAADGIPASRDLIAQYLLLYSFSGPDDFSSLVDPTHRLGVVRAYVKSDEAEFARGLFQRLNAYIAKRFSGLPVQPLVAGGALGVQTALNEEIVQDKVRNLIQISLIIFILAGLALRSVIAGLLVLAPLTFAVVFNFGVMGLSGTWLSIGTATITAMAVSIGADFAIYLMFRIREELGHADGNLTQAMRTTLLTSGKAIFFVSSAVVLGYLVLALSGFRLWVHLGVLTALMMAVSALAALTIIPSVVVLTKPSFLLRDVKPSASPPGVGEGSVEYLAKGARSRGGDQRRSSQGG